MVWICSPEPSVVTVSLFAQYGEGWGSVRQERLVLLVCASMRKQQPPYPSLGTADELQAQRWLSLGCA